MNTDSRILIGKVSGCFGVKGWLKIFSYSDPRENITSYESWIIGDIYYKDVESKKNGKLIVAKLKGINNKESAMNFIGQKIEIEPQQLAQLNNNQFYWRDLIGLTVSNNKGITFGCIKNMLETGANDVIIVQGERQRLIPFIMDGSQNQTIISVNLNTKTMVVDWHEDD